MKDKLPSLICNTTAAKEHVSNAEQAICTIKERTRGTVCTLPFEYIPRQLKIEFIYFVVLWLNLFPVKTGILSTYSPRELLVHSRLDFKKHCQVLLGLYCKVHDEPVPSNIITVQTHKCIACEPTGNLQGSLKFYCLKMGCILKWRSFTPMLMPNCIIKWVNRIGLKEKQGQDFPFLNRSKEPYNCTDTVLEDKLEYQGLLVEEEPFSVVSAKLPGVTLEEDKEEDFQVVTNKPEPAFETLAAVALENAGIDARERIWAARATADAADAMGVTAVQPNGPCLIETNEDKIVYEITFDLPHKGIILPDDDMEELPDATTTEVIPKTSHYPTQSCRSVVGNQPYDAYAL